MPRKYGCSHCKDGFGTLKDLTSHLNSHITSQKKEVQPVQKVQPVQDTESKSIADISLMMDDIILLKKKEAAARILDNIGKAPVVEAPQLPVQEVEPSGMDAEEVLERVNEAREQGKQEAISNFQMTQQLADTSKGDSGFDMSSLIPMLLMGQMQGGKPNVQQPTTISDQQAPPAKNGGLTLVGS